MPTTLDLDLIEQSIDLKLHEQKCTDCGTSPKPFIATDEGNRFIRIQCDRCKRILRNERIDKFITDDSEICTPERLEKLISCEIDLPEIDRKVQVFWIHRGYLVPVKWPPDNNSILIFRGKIEKEKDIRLEFKHPTNSAMTSNCSSIDHYWKYA